MSLATLLRVRPYSFINLRKFSEVGFMGKGRMGRIKAISVPHGRGR
jgi:hypothetical protein